MSVEIYWGSGSPFAWRALLALEVKGVAYTSRILEFSKGETRSDAFLALNPRGKVPTLRDGDFTLSESIAILAYLDRKYPDPPLFGRTAEQTGQIWKIISEFGDYFQRPSDQIVKTIFAGTVAENTESVQEASGELHKELRGFEKALGTRDWLAGDEVSAADLTVYPFIEFILRLTGRDEMRSLQLDFHPFSKIYPELESWRSRIQGLRGYDRAYPPHWRKAV